MRMWVHKPNAGGKSITPAVKLRTEQRILAYAGKHHAGKFIRIDVRFRGALCYIDAYTEPDEPQSYQPPTGETREIYIERLRNTPTHLCRIRYFGDEDRWRVAYYLYSHEKYEESCFGDGSSHGTPEEAFETAFGFL